ncbi:MAG: GNAT family N-acetyltransferase [Lachnospiraceae bacterium]|nr:GNAT family N-acetyltransferase [Lachnospiraceae bacterium]
MVEYKDYISVEDYNELRSSVKWIRVNPKRAKKALDNSYHKIIAYMDENPVGMARIVSDGGYTYFITDVIVRPDCQGNHIGSHMIEELLNFIKEDVGENETVMVSLMAAFEREDFYERFGFHTRPYGNHGPGMSMWLSRLSSNEVVKS